MLVSAIDQLRREHANMRRVLVLVRLQLDLLTAGGSADLVLLANALYYMRKYPSVVHHPKEDMIFGKLLAAGAPVEEQVERLHRQHEEIYALEDWLIELVLELQAGAQNSRTQLVDLGWLYLGTQAQHVETEEQELFPQALKFLKRRDWQEVLKRSQKIEDPLFGAHVTERYRSVYDYLMRQAQEGGCTSPDSDPGSPVPRAIQGVARRL